MRFMPTFLARLAYQIIMTLAFAVWIVTWPIAWVGQQARRVLNPYDL